MDGFTHSTKEIFHTDGFIHLHTHRLRPSKAPFCLGCCCNKIFFSSLVISTGENDFILGRSIIEQYKSRAQLRRLRKEPFVQAKASRTHLRAAAPGNGTGAAAFQGDYAKRHLQITGGGVGGGGERRLGEVEEEQGKRQALLASKAEGKQPAERAARGKRAPESPAVNRRARGGGAATRGRRGVAEAAMFRSPAAGARSRRERRWAGGKRDRHLHPSHRRGRQLAARHRPAPSSAARGDPAPLRTWRCAPLPSARRWLRSLSVSPLPCARSRRPNRSALRVPAAAALRRTRRLCGPAAVVRPRGGLGSATRCPGSQARRLRPQHRLCDNGGLPTPPCEGAQRLLAAAAGGSHRRHAGATKMAAGRGGRVWRAWVQNGPRGLARPAAPSLDEDGGWPRDRGFSAGLKGRGTVSCHPSSG